ncbi:hypothetical protein Fmac_028092 [Flemingia macrophylla]|uniref:Chalcone/stilbene synthase N-terminal domain-containing protein n=1 Tax=Flemingia macrophylla TaxID=520843 RepID=A0ABD1LJK1_9FABA
MALCLTKFLSLLLVLSVIPIGIIVTLEMTKPTTNAYYYHSSAWFREDAKWDPRNRRFIVSFFEGGLGQLKVPENGSSLLEEITVVKEPHVARNASLGVAVDLPRNRVLVVNADVCKNLYGELAAYDLSTWNRLFLTQLSGPSKLLIHNIHHPPPPEDLVENNKSARILVMCYKIIAAMFRSPFDTHLHSLVGQVLFGNGTASDSWPRPRPHGGAAGL